MVQRTSIEWTDRSANCIRARHLGTGKVGWHCVIHGPGCLHCYAAVLNKRFGTGLPFTASSRNQIELFFDPRPMEAIRRMRKPQKIFLCDMTDLFQDAVSTPMLDQTFAYIAAAPRQTFQILTKRPERMANYFRKANQWGACAAYRDLIYGKDSDAGLGDGLRRWPPRNVWAGTSVEDRKHGLPRVDHLRRIPATVRFLSIEPLLEDLGEIDLTGIDWVIVGSESGHGARPMDDDWVRSIRDQCQASSVPFFFKQKLVDGKKVGLPELDGRSWAEFPEVAR